MSWLFSEMHARARHGSPVACLGVCQGARLRRRAKELAGAISRTESHFRGLNPCSCAREGGWRTAIGSAGPCRRPRSSSLPWATRGPGRGAVPEPGDRASGRELASGVAPGHGGRGPAPGRLHLHDRSPGRGERLCGADAKRVSGDAALDAGVAGAPGDDGAHGARAEAPGVRRCRRGARAGTSAPSRARRR